MVSTTTILALLFAVIILFLLGLGPILYLKSQGYRIISVGLAGALGFFFSQIILRIPLMGVLMSNVSVVTFFAQHMTLYALFLGASAALFETLGRLFIVNICLKKRKGWLEGAVAGWGHGFCEAFIMLGITYISYIYYAFLINQGTLATMGLDPASVASITTTLSSFPAWAIIVALLERVFAMLLHCALTTLIMTNSMEGKTLIVCLAAFLFDMGLDSGGALLQINGASLFILELLPAVFAILSIGYLFKSYNKYKNA